MPCRYVVIEGKVSCYGKVLGPRDYFGHEMILTGYHRPAPVTTYTHVEAFQINKYDLARLLETGQFPRLQVQHSHRLQC